MPSHRTATTPANMEAIATMYLRGVPRGTIARTLGVSFSQVRNVIDNQLRPIWKERLTDKAELELAKIDHLESVAWDDYSRSKTAKTETSIRYREINTPEGRARGNLEKIRKRVERDGAHALLSVIQWCIEQRCKILGFYRAEPVPIEGVRVAGMTREDVYAQILEQLIKMGPGQLSAEFRDRFRGVFQASKN